LPWADARSVARLQAVKRHADAAVIVLVRRLLPLLRISVEQLNRVTPVEDVNEAHE
jgi:hypothetical protein